MSNKFKPVNQKEFYEFLSLYPRPIVEDFDYDYIYYQDASLGQWPENVVAKYWVEDEIDEDAYFILEQDTNDVIDNSKEE